jgi:hypothetical protein
MFKPMDKRGQGLTLNTIIITILVVLVLIVVVTFFFGGFKGLTERITGTFYTTTAGSDKVLAVQTCEQYCEQAKLLPNNLLKQKSAYCTQGFIIEGEITDKGRYNVVSPCGPDNKLIVGNFNADGMGENLGVGCPEVKCNR